MKNPLAVLNRDVSISTLNVDTMSCNEVVEMVSRRLTDICCVQELRWRGESARNIARGNSCNKFFWKGDDSGSGHVGVLFAEKWIDNVISVVSHIYYVVSHNTTS